jgi:hypothetical protein
MTPNKEIISALISLRFPVMRRKKLKGFWKTIARIAAISIAMKKGWKMKKVTTLMPRRIKKKKYILKFFDSIAIFPSKYDKVKYLPLLVSLILLYHIWVFSQILIKKQKND